jgi:hypothetical protein
MASKYYRERFADGTRKNPTGTFFTFPAEIVKETLKVVKKPFKKRKKGKK